VRSPAGAGGGARICFAGRSPPVLESEITRPAFALGGRTARWLPANR
jgi:hypothetical protein